MLQLLVNPSFWEERQSLLDVLEHQGEESPDFTGEDTSETLGAVRLRKVQQQTFRYLFEDREAENTDLWSQSYLRRLKAV